MDFSKDIVKTLVDHGWFNPIGTNWWTARFINHKDQDFVLPCQPLSTTGSQNIWNIVAVVPGKTMLQSVYTTKESLVYDITWQWARSTSLSNYLAFQSSHKQKRCSDGGIDLLMRTSLWHVVLEWNLTKQIPESFSISTPSSKRAVTQFIDNLLNVMTLQLSYRNSINLTILRRKQH